MSFRSVKNMPIMWCLFSAKKEIAMTDEEYTLKYTLIDMMFDSRPLEEFERLWNSEEAYAATHVLLRKKLCKCWR